MSQIQVESEPILLLDRELTPAARREINAHHTAPELHILVFWVPSHWATRLIDLPVQVFPPRQRSQAENMPMNQ